jgi:DnaJ-class molecular chaperone
MDVIIILVLINLMRFLIVEAIKYHLPPKEKSSKNDKTNTNSSNNTNNNTSSDSSIEKPINFKCTVCKGQSKIMVKENKYDSFVCELCKSVYTYRWFDSKLEIILVKKDKTIPPDIKSALDFFQYTKKIEDTIDMEIIKSKYRELLSLYHPDKVSSLGDELKEVAERKTKEIINKYNLLNEWYKGWL